MEDVSFETSFVLLIFPAVADTVPLTSAGVGRVLEADRPLRCLLTLLMGRGSPAAGYRPLANSSKVMGSGCPGGWAQSTFFEETGDGAECPQGQ